MTTLPERPDIDRDISRMDAEASIAQASDRLKFQHEIGMAAAKFVMLANGGAIIALLTFIGDQPERFDPSQLKDAFAAFSVGLAFTLASFIAGYHSQGWMSDFDTTNSWNYQQDMKRRPRKFDNKKEGRWGYWLSVIAASFVTTGLGFFVLGAFSAMEGII